MGLFAVPLVLFSHLSNTRTLTSKAAGLRRSSPPVAPSRVSPSVPLPTASLPLPTPPTGSEARFHYRKMKKGLHPQMQWISYVTQSGRLINVMMSKIHREGKVYHWRARRHMAEKLSNVEKFKRRYANTEEADANSTPPTNKE